MSSDSRMTTRNAPVPSRAAEEIVPDHSTAADGSGGGESSVTDTRPGRRHPAEIGPDILRVLLHGHGHDRAGRPLWCGTADDEPGPGG